MVRRSEIIWLIIGGLAYAIFDESTQAIVSREPDIGDFCCDMVGILSALAILRIRQGRQTAGRFKGQRAT